MKFKPKLIPTIITLTGLAVLLLLGTWQMNRLEWKQFLIKQMNEKSALPSTALPKSIDDFEKYKYRRVNVKGVFDHEKEIHLFVGARSERGRAGYDVLTPLKREDGSYVLVDRGWVDSEVKAKEKRPETLIEGDVEIEGMIHLGENRGRFTPDNDINKNLWFWINIDEIKSYAGINLQNFYVRALKKDGESSYPIASDSFIKVRNNHLQYAITWYSLAIILLIIYFLYHRKEVGGK